MCEEISYKLDLDEIRTAFKFGENGGDRKSVV